MTTKKNRPRLKKLKKLKNPKKTKFSKKKIKYQKLNKPKPTRNPKSSSKSCYNQKTKPKSKPRIIIAKKLLSDDYIKEKEGDYFDSKHYNKIVDYDCDCYYYDENNKKKILFKFRKKVLPLDQCQCGIDNLREAAKKKHDNRGAAAGKIDLKKMPSYANIASQLIGRNKFRVHSYKSKHSGKIVKNSLGNLSQSNIIGFFDKPDRNKGASKLPCRTTAFTSKYVNKWEKVLPLIKSINEQFKELIPENYRIQYKRANETDFVINDTAFSTVTINYNWRTALHKDAGDLKEGFGNLVVLEEGKYKGGETGFPQYKVAVDVRNGDFLAMNVHEWHCNTKLIPITKDFTRLSLVAYLREKMIKCKGLHVN